MTTEARTEEMRGAEPVAAPRPAPARAARPKRPGAWPVAAATLGTFLVVIAVLAIQLRNGDDPALGAGQPAAQPAKRVLVRRIIKRVVVTRVIPSPGTTSGGGGSVAGGGAGQPASAVQAAPARPSPAPVAAAPAPAPAAAPAPAPVTRSS
jgi:hypothetical protein